MDRTKIIAALILCAGPAILADSAAAQCRLCNETAASASAQNNGNGRGNGNGNGNGGVGNCNGNGNGCSNAPLTIDVQTDLDFNRLALSSTNGGTVRINAATGQTEILSGLRSLGGLSRAGTVTITGEPRARVVIDMPSDITMTTSDGHVAILRDINADIPNNPRLDSYGTYSFTFGATLEVSGNQGGVYRGRVPVNVEYR